MLLVLSDTHGEDDPRLTEFVAEQLAAATLVAHAGDFTTATVLDAFEARAAELVAVAGNSDSSAVSERLSETRTFEYAGRRFLLTHGHSYTRTSLSLLARQEAADVVVVGHTHRAGIDHVGETLVVNPGSHADPRGGARTLLEITSVGDDIQVRVQTAGGQTHETVVL